MIIRQWKNLDYLRFLILLKLFNFLPLKIQAEEHTPALSYKLCGTIRNKILNYKETVSSIYVDEDVSFVTNSDECNCQNSVFCDPFHKHIVTGDLRIVENKKLRCFIDKRSKFQRTKNHKFFKVPEINYICFKDLCNKHDKQV